MPAGEDDPATKVEIVKIFLFSMPLLPFSRCDVTTRILQIGGLGEQVLGKRLQIEEFPSMKHGWTVRGGEDTMDKHG